MEAPFEERLFVINARASAKVHRLERFIRWGVALRAPRAEETRAGNHASRAPGGARSKCARNPTGQHAGKEGSHTWRELMFGQTSTELDPRVSAIAGHLRAIEKELGGIGRSASRRAHKRVCGR
jgi:hypothetical protein